MPDEATRNDNIEQRAGDLLQAHARHASAETAAAIDVFASQSSAHADALRYAQMLQKLAPTLNCETSGPREAVQLWLEVHWTRWIGPQTTWKWLAAVPILIVCVFALQLLQPASEELPPAAAIAQAPIDYTTRWHETREITLSDGSKTWLDWQTSISESFDGTARRVTVHRGKVAFD
ncbi:MAG: FecR domain-containing protein, partial [Pseudomonadota bacterium]